MIDMDPASFHTQVVCGTLYFLLFFYPLTICLLSKVGFIGTSKASIDILYYPFFYFYNVDVECCWMDEPECVPPQSLK